MSTERFTLEFKQEAARQLVDRGYSVAEVSARLGSLRRARYLQPKNRSTTRYRTRRCGPSTLRAASQRRTRLATWTVAAYQRIGYHKTLVAIANKRARLARSSLTVVISPLTSVPLRSDRVIERLLVAEFRSRICRGW